jgi:hypothetical protein
MMTRQSLEFDSLPPGAQVALLSFFEHGASFTDYVVDLEVEARGAFMLLDLDVVVVKGQDLPPRRAYLEVEALSMAHLPMKIVVRLTNRGRAALYHLRDIAAS